jgi:hypothetical protein
MSIENLSEPVDPANTSINGDVSAKNMTSGISSAPPLLHIVF